MYEINLNENWIEGGELFVCLAQTPALEDLNLIANGEAHPNTSHFLRDFLVGPNKDLEQSSVELVAPSDDQKVLILIPEYAISMEGWAAVDSFIQRMRRPAIVFGGIGYVSGQRLLSWKNEEQNTREIAIKEWAGFNNAEHIFNTAGCWIHLPNKSTRRIIFLKNFLEQRLEISLPGIQRGNKLFRLSTNDLDIYPLICADFTSQQDTEDDPPIARIAENIRKRANGKKVLVAGLSYELRPGHAFWRNGIARAVRDTPDKKTNILIANNAVNCCSCDENQDKWRCLTGAFTSTNNLQEQRAIDLVRPLEDDTEVFGVLGRVGTPGIIAGLMSWNFGGGGVHELFRATTRVMAHNDGALTDLSSGNIYVDELSRFIRRYAPDTDCDANGCKHSDCPHRSGGNFDKPVRNDCPSQSIRNKFQAMNEVRQQVEIGNSPNASRLLTTLCHGLRIGMEKSDTEVDPDKLFDRRTSLKKGIQVLGVLALQNSEDWNQSDQLEGQLVDKDRSVSKLVWSDSARSCRKIENLLDEWCRSAISHQPLLVVSAGISGEFMGGGGLLNPYEKGKKSLRRGDTSSAPSEKQSITSSRRNKVYIIPLGRIENLWDDKNLKARIKLLLQEPMKTLTSR